MSRSLVGFSRFFRRGETGGCGARAGRSALVAAWSAACVVTLLSAGCAMSPNATREVGDDQLDRRLLLHTYAEEGALVTFAVNVDATRRREKSPYVPIGIVIANNDVARLTVDRESLTLVDDTGRRYPLATIKDVKSLGPGTLQDLRASNNFAGIYLRRFSGRTRIESVFYPIQVSEPGFYARGIVADTIELPRNNWMVDVVYFPHPEGTLLGRHYELWFAPKELEDPVFVKFAID